MRKKPIYFLLFMLVIAMALSGCSGKSTTKSSNAPASNKPSESGGTLKIAAQAQPDTLDPTVTTAEATAQPARLVFESLVTLDKNYKVAPQLAESYKTSNDGKTVTFKLRKGVKFHNGKEMKADDVIASMQKWEKNASLTKSIMDGAKWEKKDDYTVELILKKPSSVAMTILADQTQLAAVMPKEIAESAGPTGAKEYVGTGPFKFSGWKKDQYLHFTKFKAYQPVNKPASGVAGKKAAKVKDIYWYFAPDASTRSAGLISGQYDIALSVPYDAVKQIESTPGKKIQPYTYGMEILVFNKKQGLFKNVKARQAVNDALDKKVVLQSAFTDKRFYKLEPGLFRPEQKVLYSDAGKEVYNSKNLDRAKQLLQASGYKGETIKILTSRDYPHHYNAAIATQQQLEKIGMKVKLDVYDWATLLEHRDNPGDYDIFFTGWDTGIVPHQYGFLDSRANWPGWTNDPKIDQLLDQISSAKTQDETKALIRELQQEFWQYLPVINLGTYKNVNACSDKVKGFKWFIGPVLWNVSIES